MITASQFDSKTLNQHPYGDKIKHILTTAICAVEPGEAIKRFVDLDGDSLWIDEQVIDLTTCERIFVVAIGKAAVAMGSTLADILGPRMHAGVIITKHLPHKKDPRFEILQGGHPIPDLKSLYAGQYLFNLCQTFTEHDLLICLISGGGSALVTNPYPGVSLEDMQELTRILLECGARIDEINTLRRHLDQIKGGGLAKAAAPARVVSLILSDVVDNPLEAIASGPTAADPSTLADVDGIITRYQLTNKLPPGIHTFFTKGLETPKPGEALFQHVQNVVVGSNALAAQAAIHCAQGYGFDACSLGNNWQGEARQVAKTLVERLFSFSAREKPLCLVAGGESTVTIHGEGRGGRNQELALASVTALAGKQNILLVTLATDGEDGPTDAAGAVVNGESLQRAASAGLDPVVYLMNNDAYPFFDHLGDLLKPGLTGTNVNDLTFLFSFPKLGGL